MLAMRFSFLVTSLAFAAAATLAACGGSGGGGGSAGSLPPTVGGGFVTGPTPTASAGGGTSTPAPGGSPSPGSSTTPGPGSSPSPGASASANPVGSPTAAPTGYYAQGTVHDIASGLPLGGATVVLEVFKSGYATIHKPISVNQFNNQLGTLNVSAITADEAAWLQQVNNDRAAYGAGTVVLDEILQEAAQHWDNYMASNAYFYPTCAQTSGACSTAAQYEQSAGAQYTHSAQNIAAIGPGTTWGNAESGFMNESSSCPQPAQYSTCQGQTGAADFLNIITPSFVWVGLAEIHNGASYNPTLGQYLDYYTQEFGTPFQ
jgi:uncharacterized protein YkwD